MTIEQVRARVSEIRGLNKLRDAKELERELWRDTLEAIRSMELFDEACGDSSKLAIEALKTLDSTGV